MRGSTRADAAAGSILAPGTHGGDAGAVARALGVEPSALVDLSSSLNPFAPDVPALATGYLDALRAYPDPTVATVALAAAMGVDPDRLLLTNGGAEAIALVAHHLRRGSIVEPEFSLYRRHLEHVDAAAPRWRSNPGNPSGHLALPSDEAAVWDEAFYPLATGCWSRGDQESWRLGSLTKLWACAGLRLGYVLAPTAQAARTLRRRQPEWSVNGLALALMAPLLERTDLDGWAVSIVASRHELAAALRTGLADAGCAGAIVHDTDVNWLLVELPMPAVTARSQLAHAGVLVRDATSFGLPTTIRVALPRPADVERVVRSFASLRP
jgi:histidinol-phosphate/aromatic aminotransferase/cobyric acid decarboxylase-like protein